jgi:hypothetical protein
MGNSIENPNDSRSRRLTRLLRSGLIFLSPLVALFPNSVYAQAGVKEVMGAEAVRPSSDFADRPFRIYLPAEVASNLSLQQLPGMARSLLIAGEAIKNDIRQIETDKTSGN